MGADGSGQTSDVIEAIDWAIDNRRQWNIRIINVSLGHPVMESEKDDPLCQAVQRATDAGILVTVAAGNVGKLADGRPVVGGISSPGNSPAALTVGALNTKQTAARSDDVMATYSSRGPTVIDGIVKPELVAPGNRILASVPKDSYLANLLPERVVGDRGRYRHGIERHEHVVGRGGGGGGVGAGGALAEPGRGEGAAAADEQPCRRQRAAGSWSREPKCRRGSGGHEASCRYIQQYLYRQ